MQMSTVDAGLLIARIVFGSLIAAHGARKLFGWFGGPGLAAATGMFDSLGLGLAAGIANLALRRPRVTASV